jgi:hypothetical protein
MTINRSEAMRQRWADPEERDRLRESMRLAANRHWAKPDSRENHRKATRGRVMSDDGKARLSEARSLQWAAQLDQLLAGCEKVGACLIFTPTSRKVPYRRVWEATHGLKPFGMHIHHICGNGKCLNIDHLQLVDHGDNVAEMIERNGYKRRIRKLEDELRLNSTAVVLL